MATEVKGNSSRRDAGAPRLLFPLVMVFCSILFAGILNWFCSSSTEFVLMTDPAGATVYVNGRMAGASPIKLSGLAQGDYSLRLEKEGFADEVISLTLPSPEIFVTLHKHGTGVLRIDIKPLGAEVFLDGEPRGHTPVTVKDVSIGMHKLSIRKTNYNTYERRINVQAGQTLEFSGKDFQLEDKILAMLRGTIERENMRVSHYVDLAHYLFVNDRISEAGDVYRKALQVASTELVTGPDISPDERGLELRLRAEDRNRLNEEIRKKSHWAGKDVAEFRELIMREQEKIAVTNVQEWAWVSVQAANFIQDRKLAQAQKLYLDHIKAAKVVASLDQAYIGLLSLRLKMHALEASKETFNQFWNLYSNRPDLLRQAGNAMYTAHTGFQGQERADVLDMAEKLFRKGILRHGEPELNALLKFELGRVLCYQGNTEKALPYFRESIETTNDASTKELRSQILVENLKVLRNFAEMRKILNVLIKSPREQIADKARTDLKELDMIEPSPESK